MKKYSALMIIFLGHLVSLLIAYSPVIIIWILDNQGYKASSDYSAFVILFGFGAVFGGFILGIIFNLSFSFYLLRKKFSGLKLSLSVLAFTLILSALFSFEFYCVKELVL